MSLTTDLPHNTTAIFDLSYISQVLNILPPFYSSSKINLLKTNWQGKYTLLPPNEVTILEALIRNINNGTEPRLGRAVILAVFWS